MEKSKREMQDIINAQAVELLRLRAENGVLRELLGLEKKTSPKGCIIVPFTNK